MKSLSDLIKYRKIKTPKSYREQLIEKMWFILKRRRDRDVEEGKLDQNGKLLKPLAYMAYFQRVRYVPDHDLNEFYKMCQDAKNFDRMFWGRTNPKNIPVDNPLTIDGRLI